MPKHKEFVVERLNPTVDCLTEYYNANALTQRSGHDSRINLFDFSSKLLIQEPLDKDQQRAKAEELATELTLLIKKTFFEDVKEL